MDISDIHAVTFDFYNTLASHRAGRGRGAMLIAYLEEHGLESDPWDHQVLYDVFEPHTLEYDPSASAEKRHAYHVRLAERVFQRLNVRAPAGAAANHAAQVWQLLGPASLEVFSEVPVVLRLLKDAGYSLAVVSNWQCGLRHFCTELEIGEAFDHVVASAEVGAVKPDARIFEEACSRLRIPANRVLHVGDSVADDVEGGRAAGLRVVLLQREPGLPHDEVPTIRGLDQLGELLDLR